MKVKYDFHIHTALSSCALDEMTPHNIINMALISDLNAIAITDHNTCKNTQAIMTLARDTSLVVIPGIEVETAEEIHLVCLFPTISNAYKMQQFVYNQLPKLKNKTKIFGHQWLINTEDEIIGEEERLLSFATGIIFEDVIAKAWELSGIAIPAHIDRPSYSVISNLGLLPVNDLLKCLEVSQYGNYIDYISKYKDYRILQSSDSHELGYIGICNRSLDIELEDAELSPEIIIQLLRQNKN